MHFLLGLLFGYYIRGKASLLAATLVVIALLCFIMLPAIALSGLALSVRRERFLFRDQRKYRALYTHHAADKGVDENKQTKLLDVISES